MPIEIPGDKPAQAELLRTLVDKISTMVAYWDAELRCRFVNRAYERWCGVSPEALLGKHISELLGPLYSLNLPYIVRVLRGEPQQFEREIPDPAGGPARHSLAHYIPDVVDGVVRGFYVLVTDVSDMKRSELALRECEERFRLTIDEGPIGMALVAPDGRFVRVNRALCDLVGYSAEELVGLTFEAITHPDDLDKDLLLSDQLARGEISRYQLGKRFIRKDGTVVETQLSGSLSRDSGGTPIYFVAQIEDVTEQKRAEAQQRLLAAIEPLFAESLDLDDTLARIAALIVRDHADVCVIELFATDAEDGTTKAASRDPAGGSLADALVRVSLQRSAPELLRGVFDTRRSVVVQNLALGIDDAVSVRSAIVAPLVVHERTIGVLALVSTTSTKVYGAADLKLVDALAHRAALKLDNARLYRAARRATQARDDLLGVVAHDLRNPLSSIVLQAMVLSAGRNSQRAMRAIKAIEHSAKRMERLIQDLLDVAQLDVGKLSVAVDDVAVDQLLADVVEAQRPLATAASLELRLVASAGVPDVCADRDRLHQVFENLLGNAMKFSTAGGVITVAAIPQTRDVLFLVADTGEGVAPSDLPHLFDRFWQAKSIAKRKGAGLGLAIVKGIVEAHGGQIWAESTLGKGTTFYFTVPMADARAARNEVPVASQR